MLHYVHKLEEAGIERMVGLFVLYAAGLLAAALLLGSGQESFLSHYHLKAELPHGYGLKAGTSVHIIGMEVGKVDSIRFNDQNKVEIDMALRKKYREKIREDSIIRVVSLDLMGNTALEISIGSPEKPVMAEGGVIRGPDPSAPHGLPGDKLPFLAKADVAVDQIIGAVQGLNAPMEKLDAVLGQLEGLVRTINAGEGSLGAFVKDDSLSQKLTGLLDHGQRLTSSLDGATGNIQAASQSFLSLMNRGEHSMTDIQKSAERLPEIAQDWKELMAEVRVSVEKMRSVMEEGGRQTALVKDILKDFKQASENLPRMVESTRENIDEITRIIEGAEKNWVVKGFLERENTAPPIVLEARENRYEGAVK